MRILATQNSGIFHANGNSQWEGEIVEIGFGGVKTEGRTMCLLSVKERIVEMKGGVRQGPPFLAFRVTSKKISSKCCRYII